MSTQIKSNCHNIRSNITISINTKEAAAAVTPLLAKMLSENFLKLKVCVVS